MKADHLVLAGGGHSHALLLRRWAMNPNLRPAGLITLVNRNSVSLYSGMVPGLISGFYSSDEVSIDFRHLTKQSGAELLVAEILGLDVINNRLLLADRPHIDFTRLSLDVGSETKNLDQLRLENQYAEIIPIKPLEQVLTWLNSQDPRPGFFPRSPITVVGSGLSGIEVAMALRNRWPSRQILLQTYKEQSSHSSFRRALSRAEIDLIPFGSSLHGQTLLCTGSKAPDWLALSGLPVDVRGRVRTKDTLQVLGKPFIFASGDCAVVDSAPRPPSGVWAVRAARPLARNLERHSRNLAPQSWRPQRKALKLLGFQTPFERSKAWALWGSWIVGPNDWIWRLKEFIDRSFMNRFVALNENMSRDTLIADETTSCRGCAAKLSAKTLRDALGQAGLSPLASSARDAFEISLPQNGDRLLQSVDGFPALVTDPWLNGRLTALHACSDIWASGANVISAQTVITLPLVHSDIQKELLAQTLLGIQSSLEPQGAKLVGGHTLESRSKPLLPYSLGIQVTLAVNGRLTSNDNLLEKGGMQCGDVVLLSRALGTGVIFAAAMSGRALPKYVDVALEQMSRSQHLFLSELRSLQNSSNELNPIHACTDITGFGLLGHLEEMLDASNNLLKSSSQKVPLAIRLDAEEVPALPGALDLLEQGHSSTLAPANRGFLNLLTMSSNCQPKIYLTFKEARKGSDRHKAILELLVDPQTCGPLLVTCSTNSASKLLAHGHWFKIGNVIRK